LELHDLPLAGRLQVARRVAEAATLVVDGAPRLEHGTARDQVGAGVRRPVHGAALEAAEAATVGQRDLVTRGVPELRVLRSGVPIGLEDRALDHARPGLG